MNGAVVILCTCADEAEAMRISQTVVNERLAACVNVFPPVRSVYRWQGAVEEAAEVLIMVKTTAERFAELRTRLVALHSYDTPEIIALPIVEGLDKYLAWIHDQVS